MEALKFPDVGQTEATLTLLRDLIHNQRLALGQQQLSLDELEMHLAAWEEMLHQLQRHAALDRNARLGLLYEASQALAQSIDWEETVQNVMDLVIRVTGAERGMVMLVEDGTWRVLISRTDQGLPFDEGEVQFSHSIIQQMIAQGRALLTNNAQRDPRFSSSESIIAYGLRSILCAPLMVQGELLGALYLENRMKSGIFSPDDLATLAAFANQAALALANARAHQQTSRALLRSVRELRVLQEMARDLNANFNHSSVMEHSVRWVTTAIEAESGALGLLAEEGLRWVARLGETEPDSNAAWQALRQRRPDFTPHRLLLPLLREERPLGIFWLQAGKRPFTEEEYQFAVRLADTAAIAIENARLYEALVRADQAKNDFVSLVSHELRTPMTSIRGYTDMLRKGVVGPLTPQQQEFMDVISRNVERMRIMVSDLLDISRMESGKLRLNPVSTSLKAAVEEAVRIVQEQLQSKQQFLITDIPDSLPPVYADPDRLAQVLINLLGNAVKYTPARGTIAVRAKRHEKEPGFIHCAVMDNGIGISPEDQQRLFTKFFRSENPTIREQTGTGLGLAIARNLVEMHGGSMWVESTLGVGSVFHFTLPEAPPEEPAGETVGEKSGKGTLHP
ncbi:MAG: GAF domain-containing sensor histidine kinase [Anaerolineae bacterium]|nr:GAF domain-containing sensor histidine kinase [Anaerolineae bacterium]HXK42295.1 GAF domain-containing sensor histidine kinase [Anaerolineae bacterium]